jgi:cytochrome c
MKKFIFFITIFCSTILLAESGESIVKEKGCMACHNIMGKKLAPAFKGIGRRNLKWYGNDAKIKIIDSIKNGSQGKYRNFTGSKMPSFNMSAEKLNKVADWIISLYVTGDRLGNRNQQNSQGQGQNRSGQNRSGQNR